MTKIKDLIKKSKKCIISLLYLFIFSLTFGGCFLAKDNVIHFDINGQQLDIHLFICILLTCISILFSLVAIKKFSNDIMRIAEQEEQVLQEKKHSPEDSEKMLLITGIYIILPTIIFSWITYRIVRNFNFNPVINFYIIILAIMYITTMLLAFGCALYIIFKISSIFNEEFKQYDIKYPIATQIFRECYHIFFHGIVLFWVIGILLFILITLLCLNTAAASDTISLNIYTIITAYISILLGFILSTIYPYYITKRKVEELKLESINKLNSENNKNHKDIQQIKESPNNINSNTSVRVYSTLTIIISIVAQLCTIYTLSNGS